MRDLPRYITIKIPHKQSRIRGHEYSNYRTDCAWCGGTGEALDILDERRFLIMVDDPEETEHDSEATEPVDGSEEIEPWIKLFHATHHLILHGCGRPS